MDSGAGRQRAHVSPASTRPRMNRHAGGWNHREKRCVRLLRKDRRTSAAQIVILIDPLPGSVSCGPGGSCGSGWGNCSGDLPERIRRSSLVSRAGVSSGSIRVGGTPGRRGSLTRGRVRDGRCMCCSTSRIRCPTGVRSGLRLGSTVESRMALPPSSLKAHSPACRSRRPRQGFGLLLSIPDIVCFVKVSDRRQPGLSLSLLSGGYAVPAQAGMVNKQFTIHM